MAVPAPVAAPRIVGRRDELAAVSAALASGARGEPRAVMVKGEAGIGKTRLITDALDAHTRDSEPDGAPPAVVAWGQCVDLGPIGAPFTPVRRLLRTVVAAVGQDAFVAAAGGEATLATLAALVPELADRRSEPGDGGASRVAEAIERVVEQLSRERHLVLVIEDLHWADTATMALLTTLAVTARSTHLTLIMTYRSDDVGRGHPLRAVLAELDRTRAVDTIELARLSPDHVADQARQILGREAGADELESLVARSEGVPFFVEELLELPAGALPDTLRDVVLARYDRLSPLARSAVKAAAVAGVRVDARDLESLWQGTEPALLDAVREAVATGMIVADEHGYAFRHALIQEAVYDELLPSERVSGHAAIAALLQRRVDDGDRGAASAAAEHWIKARDDDHAFAASVIARDEARAEHALATAARLGERLLELWPRVAEPEARAGSDAGALRAQIARDYLDAGRNRDVYRVVDDSLAALPEDAAVARAQLHHVAMLAATETHGCMHGVDHAAEVDTLLEGSTDPAALPLRVRALAMRAATAPDTPSREALMARAFTLAEGMNDPDAWGFLLRRHSNILTYAGRYEEALAAVERARELAGPLTSGGLRAAINVTDMHLVRGTFRESIAIGEEAVAAAVAAGHERSAGAFLHVNLAEAYIAVGERDRGIEHARVAATLTRGESGRWLSCAMSLEATARLWSGDLAGAMELERDSAPVRAAFASSLEDRSWWYALRMNAALIESAAGRPAVRRASLTAALGLAAMLEEDDAPEQFEHVREVAVATARLLGALERAGGEPDLALARRVVTLATHRDGDHADEPYRAIITAHVAHALGDPDALERWRHAVEVGEGRIACRHSLDARYRHALAELDAGDRERAVALLRAVVEDASAAGVSIVSQWARDALARAGDGATGTLAGLTGREREVLALVAEGLTNPQIGTRLYISPKTASVHVSAILAKVGAANRAEAAAWYAAHADATDAD